MIARCRRRGFSRSEVVVDRQGQGRPCFEQGRSFLQAAWLALIRYSFLRCAAPKTLFPEPKTHSSSETLYIINPSKKKNFQWSARSRKPESELLTSRIYHKKKKKKGWRARVVEKNLPFFRQLWKFCQGFKSSKSKSAASPPLASGLNDDPAPSSLSPTPTTRKGIAALFFIPKNAPICPEPSEPRSCRSHAPTKRQRRTRPT